MKPILTRLHTPATDPYLPKTVRDRDGNEVELLAVESRLGPEEDELGLPKLSLTLFTRPLTPPPSAPS
jgi:hypothetical protein